MEDADRYEDLSDVVMKRYTAMLRRGFFSYSTSYGGNKLSDTKKFKNMDGDIQSAIKLILLDPDPLNLDDSIVGSFKYHSQLFSDVDIRQIYEVIDHRGTSGERFAQVLQNLVRQIETRPDVIFSNVKLGDIHWSAPEILRGFKTMPFKDGYFVGDTHEISLADAVLLPGVKNLEVWKNIADRWVEMSNFLVFKDSDGVINGEENFYQQVLDDVYHYKHDGNLFKALKRAWVLVRAMGESGIINKARSTRIMEELQPLLRSDLTLMYQAISDLKTMRDMSDSGHSVRMDRQLQHMKSTLGLVYQMEFDRDFARSMIDKMLNATSTHGKMVHMSELIDYLGNRLNRYVARWAAKNNIWAKLPFKDLP